MIPAAYRALLRDPRTRRLLLGLGVSSLGDGMSTVTIAWLAVRTAPAGELGLFVGLAVAAYTLPGAVGALALDAASFAFLGGQAWRTHTAAPTTDEPVDVRAAESGFRLLRRNDLLGL